MMIIGCDLHTRYQQIAMLHRETGELVERRLEHENGEARAFYTALAGGWPTFKFSVKVGTARSAVTGFFLHLRVSWPRVQPSWALLRLIR
jgi:hypothetical protein